MIVLLLAILQKAYGKGWELICGYNNISIIFEPEYLRAQTGTDNHRTGMFSVIFLHSKLTKIIPIIYGFLGRSAKGDFTAGNKIVLI